MLAPFHFSRLLPLNCIFVGFADTGLNEQHLEGEHLRIYQRSLSKYLLDLILFLSLMCLFITEYCFSKSEMSQWKSWKPITLRNTPFCFLLPNQTNRSTEGRVALSARLFFFPNIAFI